MKNVFEVLSVDVMDGLPSANNVTKALDRVGELQLIPNIRDFHASNIEHLELEGLLTNIGTLSYTGAKKSEILTKIKRIKPTSRVPVIDFI